jgi:hypothetical protein
MSSVNAFKSKLLIKKSRHLLADSLTSLVPCRTFAQQYGTPARCYLAPSSWPNVQLIVLLSGADTFHAMGS